METLSLPKSVLIKEIIRYEEDMYILNAEAEFCTGWEYSTSSIYIRTDVKALAELLRLENPILSGKIEDVLLSMLSFGEPSRIDIKQLTGDYLLLCNSELVLSTTGDKKTSESIHDLAQIVDVFAKFHTEPLGLYLNIEKEFSKEILERNFNDFQKAFFLINRGYNATVAAELTQTNNPVSAMIYNKIKQQLAPEETIVVPIAKSQEDIIEENYSFKELVGAYNTDLPF